MSPLNIMKEIWGYKGNKESIGIYHYEFVLAFCNHIESLFKVWNFWGNVDNF